MVYLYKYYIMDTLELIVKPTQSGKTFIMLQEISKMLENDDDTIHIIFCDNQLLQTEQTNDRLEKYDGLETYISDDGYVSLILSCKSKIIKFYTQLTHYICNNLKTIVTCSNKKRVDDIDKLIKSFSQSKKLNEYKFSIWIDEIDKNIQLFKDYLKEWDKHPSVKRIGLITATPGNVLKIFNIIKIFELKESYDREKYHSFSESEFKLLNFNDLEIELYIQKVMNEFSNLIKIGQVWFIPGEVNTNSHGNIKDFLIKLDFTVIIINGKEKKIFYNNKSEDLPSMNNDALADSLGDYYITNKLHLKKVAITGNLCVNRGITINSNKMLITHAIFPTKINNPSSSYQLAGRICGNIKEFKNYKKPTIFCSNKFKNIICDMENRAKNLAEKAFTLQKQSVSLVDYNMADSNICNKGIPILLNLNKNDLSIITKVEKLSDKTRNQIENILKKYKLTNENIDFDINKFRLRNKSFITKDDVDENGVSKYEYLDFMDHYKNKKSKQPNKNCGINEYLIYIIVDDIEIWKAKAGDSIIIYKNNEIEI